VVVTHGGNVFEAARGLGCDWREILDFSASINPLGPSPEVPNAIVAAMDEIAHYPDPYATRLRAALAHEWNIEPERILVGNGATELIHFLARTWPVEATLITPVFSEFHRAYPLARLDEWSEDGLLVLTNPVNPTGAAAAYQQRRGITWIDESFLDFSDLPTRMNEPRCIVLRSLTKFHALPGLRIGALVGPADLVRQWQALREPWQVNVLAEAAAMAALNDKAHQRRTRDYVVSERERLWRAFADMPGAQLHPTHANYYFAKLAYAAAPLCDYLHRHKILLRNCTGMPGVQGEAVRFAIRTCEDNDRLLQLWRAFPCD
jgi:threonine-phosphate decarboxylase